ncbi:MAG: glycosyltransferase [Candidatus Microbacterium stercoravium]
MTGSAHDDTAPLLSVVIPTHNVRPWLRQALDSVLRQQADLEAIVVDDRSDDGTLDLAREVAERDPRVRVVASTGAGGGSARNTGAELARGRYLIFADGDDLIPDGAYAALVSSLEESGSDMAVGDYIKFRAVDTWRPTAAMPAFAQPAQRITLTDAPTLLFSRPCWNRAFRRDFWSSSGIRFPDVPRSNDIVPMARALVGASSIDVVEDVVYVYRERPGSGSMTARAGAATSLDSYLTQETECAALVRATGDAGLAAVFADLTWDRDAFVAVNRYLLAWESPSEGDEVIASRLRALLDIVPAPDGADPLRRLALTLAADGAFAAGHAVSRVAGGHPEGADPAEERADLVATWRALVAELDRRGPGDDERALIVERLSRQLAQPHTGRPEAWHALVDEAERVLGARVRLFAADAWQDPATHADRVAARERTAARAHGLAGGDLLAIDGTVSPDAGAVEIALFDGEASLDSGTPRLIRPVSTTWRTARDGVRTWSAAFPAHELPLHRPLTPVTTADGAMWNVDAAFELPAFSRRDAFLYDIVDRILIVRRRRSWVVRGAVSAARRVVTALRRGR